MQKICIKTGMILLDGVALPSNMRVEFTACSYARMPGNYELVVDPDSVQVYTNDLAENVTAHYTLQYKPGILTILAYNPTIDIEVNDINQTYTGHYQHISDAHGAVTIDGLPMPAELTVMALLNFEELLPSTYAMDWMRFKVLVTDSGEDITSHFLAGYITLGFVTIEAPAEKIPTKIIIDDAIIPYTGHEKEVTVTTGSIIVDDTPAHNSVFLIIKARGKGLGIGTYPIDKVVSGPYIVFEDDSIGAWNILNKYHEMDVVSGKLKIEEHAEKVITIVPDDKWVPFDGALQHVCIETGQAMLFDDPLPDYLKIEFKAFGGGRMPGSGYSIDVDPVSVRIVDISKGVDVTSSYKLILESGTLTIEKTMPLLWVEPVTRFKTYNSMVQHIAINDCIATINGESLPDGLQIEMEAHGSGIAAGHHRTTIDSLKVIVTEENVDVTDCFSILRRNGVFEILPPEEKIIIEVVPDNVSYPFNNQYQSAFISSGTATIGGADIPNYLRVNFYAMGGGMDPGTYTITCFPTFVVEIYDPEKDAWINTSTCYEGHFFDSTFTITEADKILIIRPNNAETLFDGSKKQVVVNQGTVSPYTDFATEHLNVTYMAIGEGRLPGRQIPIVIDRQSVRVSDKATGQNLTHEYGIITEEGVLLIQNEYSTLDVKLNNVIMEYNGAEIEAIANEGAALVNGLPISSDLTFSILAKGNGIAPGLYEMKVETCSVKALNSSINLVQYFNTSIDPGIFQIIMPKEKTALTIQPEDQLLEHTGEEISVSVSTGVATVNGESMPENLRIHFVISGCGTEGGEYPIGDLMDLSISIYDAIADTWVDVTDCYDCEIIPGVLTIEEYDGYQLSYTGNHTKELVVHQGKQWEEWALTTSGTLTFGKGKIPPCSIWLCGGGGGGGMAGSTGGGGGYATSINDYTIQKGDTSIVIGKGGTGGKGIYNGGNGGDTKIGAIVAKGGYGGSATAGSGNGGSGGGASSGRSAGKGDGKSKIPFGDTLNYPLPFCAGGGGGGYEGGPDRWSIAKWKGGDGGSNGGNGSSCQYGSNNGGIGGRFGGGPGITAFAEQADVYSGMNATHYGGGGGGGAKRDADGIYNLFNGGPGYQGIVYIRIPLDE